MNFQKRSIALFKNVGVIWISEVKQIFGDSSTQMSSSDVRTTEIEYLNSPITGSRPNPIESLTRCKLSFSTHASCNSCGSVKKNTVTISWYPYKHRLDECEQRGNYSHTPGNSLIEVVFGKVTQAIHEAPLVVFHGHISSLQYIASTTHQEPLCRLYPPTGYRTKLRSVSRPICRSSWCGILSSSRSFWTTAGLASDAFSSLGLYN